MDNIIFDEYGCQVKVTFLGVHNEKVYIVMNVQNNTDMDRTFYLEDISNMNLEYRSKVTGLHRYLGVFPLYKGGGSYDIPAGYFQEVQLAFDCNTISEGDSFELEWYFNTNFQRAELLFSYVAGEWMVNVKFLETKTLPGREYSKVLEFKKADDNSENKVIENPIQQLESLIGLSTVKEEVKTLANFVKVQKLRQSKGITTSPISYHCVFTGNPGTGKTTVARILAAIYKDLGILKKGHLVETDRSGLVGGYVGQTAIKTNAVIDSALDGVLFIDEAYSLSVSDNNNDFGHEAIATLLKRMEDNRDRLVVIVAGYTKEMTVFINSNSGLKSRFSRYIHFPDYSADELFAIYMHISEAEGYSTTDEASGILKAAFREVTGSKDKEFGNGRYVRNVFEDSIKAQANRIATKDVIKDEDLSLITDDDIKAALKKIGHTS